MGVISEFIELEIVDPYHADSMVSATLKLSGRDL